MKRDSLANWALIHHCLLLALGAAADVLRLTVAPNNLDVRQGENGMLSCRSSVSSQVECKWLHGENQVQVGTNRVQWVSSPTSGDCSIHILESDVAEHGGRWQCTVIDTSNHTQVIQSDPVLLNVLVEPTVMNITITTPGEWKDRLEIRHGKMQVPLNTRVTLECSTCCANPPTLNVWVKDVSVTFNATDDKIQDGMTSSSLHLFISRQHHGHMVSCLSFHPTLENGTWRRDVAFDVLYGPENVTRPQYIVAQAMSPVMLTCPMHGHPPPSYVWSVFQENVWQDINSSDTTTLQVHESSPSGLYQCTATSNILGRKYVAITAFNFTRLELTTESVIPSTTPRPAIVTEKTTTQSPTRTEPISLHSTVTLSCQPKLFSQRTNETFQWYFKGLNSTSWEHLDIDGFNLTLSNITSSQIGTYKYTTRNSSMDDDNLGCTIYVILYAQSTNTSSEKNLETIILSSIIALILLLILIILIIRLKKLKQVIKESNSPSNASPSGSETKYVKPSWPKLYRGRSTSRVYAVVADVKDSNIAKGLQTTEASTANTSTEQLVANGLKWNGNMNGATNHMEQLVGNGGKEWDKTSKTILLNGSANLLTTQKDEASDVPKTSEDEKQSDEPSDSNLIEPSEIVEVPEIQKKSESDLDELAGNTTLDNTSETDTNLYEESNASYDPNGSQTLADTVSDLLRSPENKKVKKKRRLQKRSARKGERTLNNGERPMWRI